MTRPSEIPVVKSAKERTRKVIKSIKQTMAVIEDELKENEGIYPRNRGRLSMAEVCRRAGVHEITMMGKAHCNTTRPMIIAWLQRLKAVKGSAMLRSTITSRMDVAQEKYQHIASQFQAMYQVEMPKRDNEIAQLRARVAELEAENLRLREQVSQSRVVRMPTMGKRNK